MAAYKDKNGKWYISVYYTNWQGKRDRKVKRGFSTKREALEWEREFLNQTSGDLDMTFEAFVELYKLKKLLKEAKKTISDLKAKIQSLTTELAAVKAELAQYKSVRSKLRTPDLEQENDRLRKRIRTYEEAISRNNLWYFFKENRNKNRNRDDAR